MVRLSHTILAFFCYANPPAEGIRVPSKKTDEVTEPPVQALWPDPAQPEAAAGSGQPDENEVGTLSMSESLFSVGELVGFVLERDTSGTARPGDRGTITAIRTSGTCAVRFPKGYWSFPPSALYKTDATKGDLESGQRVEFIGPVPNSFSIMAGQWGIVQAFDDTLEMVHWYDFRQFKSCTISPTWLKGPWRVGELVGWVKGLQDGNRLALSSEQGRITRLEGRRRRGATAMVQYRNQYVSQPLDELYKVATKYGFVGGQRVKFIGPLNNTYSVSDRQLGFVQAFDALNDTAESIHWWDLRQEKGFDVPPTWLEDVPFEGASTGTPPSAALLIGSFAFGMLHQQWQL